MRAWVSPMLVYFTAPVFTDEPKSWIFSPTRTPAKGGDHAAEGQSGDRDRRRERHGRGRGKAFRGGGREGHGGRYPRAAGRAGRRCHPRRRRRGHRGKDRR